ncbi:MAG: site-specific integrase [Muribaculaceae bacterium]|nr:site-specific integrase [Muribaculaceae bacterium]
MTSIKHKYRPAPSPRPANAPGVTAFAGRLIDEMQRIGKRAMARRFEAVVRSLLRYTAGNEVAWNELTDTFVLGYEEFMRTQGLCRNSTSFYMRNLRSIVNRAAREGVDLPHDSFGQVYTGVDRTAKRAVGIDTVRRIRDLDLSSHPELDFARNVFMFAFYTRGMSFVDIAYLRKSDLHEGVITYSRRKTRQQLAVRIESETRSLIDRFGRSDTHYLLPIITDETDPARQYENAYYRVNRNIQRVGRMLHLDKKLTLYVARHAWASIAHANNVSLSTISKAMGHDSEKTTIIYLQSLDTTAVDKANSDIIRLIDKS